MAKIGDVVGAIHQVLMPGNADFVWCLRESEITKIVETKNGRRCYTKKNFNPLDEEDLDGNTRIQEQIVASNHIMTSEVFILNETTRPVAEQWVIRSNKQAQKGREDV